MTRYGLELRNKVLCSLYTEDEIEKMDDGESPNELVQVERVIEKKMEKRLYENWGYPKSVTGGLSPDVLDVELEGHVFEDVFEYVTEELEKVKEEYGEMKYMPEDTLWMNKTSDGQGAIVNVDGEVYYVKLEKVEQFVEGELGHGLPLDKIGEDGDQE